MADDTLPTLWRVEPHTQAKLDILEKYLQAWMPILSKRVAREMHGAKEVLYIDAFAGPGTYENGEPGSPLVAIRSGSKHTQEFPVPVHVFFIEKREDRYHSLDKTLRDYEGSRRNIIVESPILGEAEPKVREILASKVNAYCPALVFLDQFGYSAVSMEMISEILSGTSREVLSFMNWRDLNRYLGDETKWAGIDRAFGGQEWREILHLEPARRSQRFLQIYDNALKSTGGASFSCIFSMHDRNDQLIYWLIFCTNNDRGLEEMKKAMWSVDSTGNFQFSDKHSGQMSLLPGFDQEWLADLLASSLEKREMNLCEVWHYVLTETPCFRFSRALASLETEGRLTVVQAPKDRRKGSFAKYKNSDDVLVRFEKQTKQLTLL